MNNNMISSLDLDLLSFVTGGNGAGALPAGFEVADPSQSVHEATRKFVQEKGGSAGQPVPFSSGVAMCTPDMRVCGFKMDKP